MIKISPLCPVEDHINDEESYSFLFECAVEGATSLKQVEAIWRPARCAIQVQEMMLEEYEAAHISIKMKLKTEIG